MKIFSLKKTLLLLCLLTAAFVFSQDRIYFDEDWQITTKDKMVYYREVSQKDKLIHIKDFYKNGVLQMEGDALDASPNSEIFDGKVTWYYPSGKPQTITEYRNGETIGVSKDYDEQGRLLKDFVFDQQGNYSGFSYSFKNEYTEYSSYYEYKNSQYVKSVVFDNDQSGIRYETYYGNDSQEKETKFFGEAGKLIGSRITKDDKLKGMSVDYFYNPMRVAKIDKYGTQNYIDESTQYYENGKIAQETKYGKNSGTKISYDQNGKKIAELVYKYDKEYKEMQPWNGEDLNFSYSAPYFESAVTYSEGKITNNKTFYQNEKVKSEIFYNDNIQTKSNFYNEDGSLKGSLLNDEYGYPFNGNLYTDYSESVYKEGKLISEKAYTEDKKLHYERKLLENGKVEVKVYDSASLLQYYYQLPSEAYSEFTTEVTQYENGKPKNKATFENGIMQKGKIAIDTYDGKIEYERQGEWLVMKQYDINRILVKESKEKINTDSEYSSTASFYEDTFLNGYY